MPDDRFSPASLPRPLRIALVAVAAILLTSFFVYLGFPYDLLAGRLASRVEQATGMRLSYGPVTASPQLQGPGIAIADLRLRAPGGDSWDFSRLVLRPAWSLSWLQLQPSIHLDGESSIGHIRGTARLSGDPAFDGEATGLDLAALLRSASVQADISGSADVEADLRFGPDGAEGPVSLSARDGVISHPKLPLDVPYQKLDAELVFGGDNLVQIVSCDVDSPMGKGSIQGRLGHARALATAPIELTIDITAAENMRAALRAQRVRIGEDGRIQLDVRGSLARPIVR